jgi:hypothetical protein
MNRSLILTALLCVSTFAAAQKVDAAFVVGGAFGSDVTGTAIVLPFGPNTTQTIESTNQIFFEGELGIRLLNAHLVSFYAELPVAGIPSQPIKFLTEPGGLAHLGTVFITPGIRLKFAPAAPVSPWAGIGGGYAHYSLDTFNTTDNKAVFEYGGGFDIKTGIPLLGFRAEVRDFVTDDPNFGIPEFVSRSGFHHHNILAGGGVVLRF